MTKTPALAADSAGSIVWVSGIGRPGYARDFHVSREARARYEVEEALFSLRGRVLFADFSAAQKLAQRINKKRDSARFPHAAVRPGDLYAAGLLDELLHLAVEAYREQVYPTVLQDASAYLKESLGEEAYQETLVAFTRDFPPLRVFRGELTPEAYLEAEESDLPNAQASLEEVLMLWLANENPALEGLLELFDDTGLEQSTAYSQLIGGLQSFFADQPGFGEAGESLLDMLRAPALASPTSLEGQLNYIRERWGQHLGGRFSDFMTRLLKTVDVIKEERKGGPPGGPGPAQVLDFEALEQREQETGGRARAEYERFSPDSSWMPRVVLLAKTTYVWLAQLSKKYGRTIERLDEVPDEELDELAARGFTSLWLIGLWERSEASKRIKHLRGNPDAVASAYSLYDYVIAADLGGETAYESLRDRAWGRGIRLASDMVPNHVGIDGRWVIEHPDWFLSLDHPPYPGYSFDGPDLSSDARVGVFIEDHYYDNSDAAVVFKRLDRHTGEARYVYHGNDGTSMPWNDTAQLNYLNPEVREAVIQTIFHVARKFSIIRFDAAMTLAKQHIQRLWFPEPGHGGAIPSRTQYGSMSHEAFERRIPHEFWREVVDRVAEEVPDTLLLAEAFWMMEGYFVRTLGMHRVYNSAFMNMLKNQENAKYRQTIKNTLAFDPEILKRFVNFMNNPDEETAAHQFGKDDKYFGVCVLLSTMPGLPMFGHGQVEGFEEKYGMEYRRPKWDETPNEGLIARHAYEIFPLLHRRKEFAEVEEFRLYDVQTERGVVEDVFAYSNSFEGKRSLVLYNNAFAEVRGHIKTSVPFVVKTGGGKETRRQDVHEALALEGGDGHFLCFRDQITGLEHIRRSREIARDGFPVSLGAFKYQVLMDLREVEDRTGEGYARLHDELSGRGVPSLEDALKDMRLRPLHEALDKLLEPAQDDADEVKKEDDLKVEEKAAKAVSVADEVTAADEDDVEAPQASKAKTEASDQAKTKGQPQDETPGEVAAQTQDEDDAAVSEAARPLTERYAAFLQEAEARGLELKNSETMTEAFLAHAQCLRDGPDLDQKQKTQVGEGIELSQGLSDVLMLWSALQPFDAPSEHAAEWRLSPYLERRLDDDPTLHADLFSMLLNYVDWHERFEDAEALLDELKKDVKALKLLRVNEHEGVRWFDQGAYRLLVKGLLWVGLLERTRMNTEIQPVLDLIEDLRKAEDRSEYKLSQLRVTKQAEAESDGESETLSGSVE